MHINNSINAVIPSKLPFRTNKTRDACAALSRAAPSRAARRGACDVKPNEVKPIEANRPRLVRNTMAMAEAEAINEKRAFAIYKYCRLN